MQWSRAWLSALMISAIVAASVFHVTPATAQNITLVTNFNQERAATEDAYDAGPSGTAIAQGFTTGNAVTLSSIEVVGRSSVTGEHFGQEDIRAELWSANSSGAPKAKIADLTVPADAFADTETTHGKVTLIRTVSDHGASVSFAAPGNTRLDANTTYFLVVYTVAIAGELLLDATSSDNEDVASRPGWSIADQIYAGLRNNPGQGFISGMAASTANSIQIAVHGSPAPATVSLSAYPAQVWEGQSSRVKATLSHALPIDVNIPVHVSPCDSGSWCHYLHSSKNRAIRIPAGSTEGYLRVLHPDDSVRYENKRQSENVTVTGPYVSLLTFRDVDAEHEYATISLKSELPDVVRAGGKTSQDFTVLDPDGMSMTLTADNQPAEGNTNSRITETLEAGEYTIEATTNEAEQLGTFNLTVSGLGGTPGPPQRTRNRCVETLSGDGTVTGSWAANCRSQVEGRGYARYYTFTLDEDAAVSINLESSIDTYLYLRSGNARSGSALREHNDIVVFKMTVTLDLGQPAPDGFYALLNSSASTATYAGSVPSITNYDDCSWENPCPVIRDWTMEPRPQDQGTGDLEGLIAGGTLPEAPIGHPCAVFHSDGRCVRHVERPSESEWNSQQWQRVTWLKDWGGKQKKTITLAIGDDPDVDPDETIVLQATGYGFPVPVKNGKLESNKLTLTIKDNDGATDDTDDLILMGGVDTYARESGTGADSYARVPVWLSRPATQEVTVDYTTLTDTATVHLDYMLTQSTLTFAPGETRKEITVPIKDDNLEDSGEIFKIRLSNPMPSSLVSLADTELAYAEVNVTIVNNEADLDGLQLWGASASDAPFATLDIGAFDAATTDYAVTVPHGTTHAKIAGIEPEDAYLKLKAGVAGSTLTAVNSRAPSPALALAVGDTVLVVEATAPSGEQKTYEVTVTRQAPVDGAPAVAFPIADLDGLPVGDTRQVSLSGVFSYHGSGALSIAARSSDTDVAGVTAAADGSSLAVLGVAEGTATITVTADDGSGGSVDDVFTVRVTPPPPGPEPRNVQVVPKDGVITVTWEASPFYYKGSLIDDDRIKHALRWWQGSNWANPVGENAFGQNDGIHVETGVTSYEITGLTNGVAVEVQVRAFFGSNHQEGAMNKGESSTSSKWVVSKTVVPREPNEGPNQPPTVSATIADATIVNESGTSQVFLSGVFTDADWDVLSISAISSNKAVATAGVSTDHATLTVTAKARGTATVTVTADDGNGGTVEDTFTVTVKAAPVVASAIADVSSLEIDATHDVSLSGVFSDSDGDALTVTASSSNDAIATVGVAADQSSLTLTGKGKGTATITVTAQDSDGNSVSDAFDVTVNVVPEEQTTVSETEEEATVSETEEEQDVVARYDTNQDGVISRTEYNAAAADIITGKVTLDEVLRVRQAWEDGGFQQ